MSDLDKFIALYKELGIELEPEHRENTIVLILAEGDNPKLIGYGSFYSEIEFDKNGEFNEQGFWE